MAYQVIARKWRPQTFEEVVGQEHVTTTLKNAIASGRIGHAYLFSGIRGVGKTTVARILAKALNCEHGPTQTPCNKCVSCSEITQGTSLDVKEIDGASNRGIDSVRDLREGVAFSPARDRYKVYIIDEVHMLTTEAFNALLKTLEEPPPHVVFILATTELHKVPATIASRCQVFEFRRISHEVLVKHLARIASAEGFEISEDALRLIARQADGSLRDASSLLEQVASFGAGKVDEALVREVLRTSGRFAIEVLSAILSQDPSSAMRLFLDALSRGVPPKQFLNDIARVLSDAIKVRLFGEGAGRELGLTSSEVADLRMVTHEASLEWLATLLQFIVLSADQVADSRNPDLLAQAAILKASTLKSFATIEGLIERLEEVSKRAQGEGLGQIRLVDLSPPSEEREASRTLAPKLRLLPLESETRRPSSDQRGASEGKGPHVPKDEGPRVLPRPGPGDHPGGSSRLRAEEALLEKMKKHPVVERVIEIFGGDIVSVRPEEGLK